MVAALPEARGFALAGGGALVVHGLTERSTNDLDFFTPAPTDVPLLGQALVIAFREAGLTVSIVRDTETFVRLAVGDGTTDTLVDLAWDARMRPAVASDLGPVLNQEELAADKVLALFGRAEPRDFLDVYGLSQRLGWPRLLALAEQKDAGFSPERLAESLGRMNRLDQADFGIEDADYLALRAWVDQTPTPWSGVRSPKRPGRRQ